LQKTGCELFFLLPHGSNRENAFGSPMDGFIGFCRYFLDFGAGIRTKL